MHPADNGMYKYKRSPQTLPGEKTIKIVHYWCTCQQSDETDNAQGQTTQSLSIIGFLDCITY